MPAPDIQQLGVYVGGFGKLVPEGLVVAKAAREFRDNCLLRQELNFNARCFHYLLIANC